MWDWHEHWMKAGSAAIGLVMAGGTAIYSGVQWHDNTYAHNDELVLVEMRLDQKILNDRINAIQFRMWKMEERYGPEMSLAKEGRDDVALDEYRALKLERQELQRQLGNIENRIMQQQYQKQ